MKELLPKAHMFTLSATYPTAALRFSEDDQGGEQDTLNGMSTAERTSHAQHDSRDLAVLSAKSWIKLPPKARLPIEILVVGAGLGGLAVSIALALAGHKVTVFEQAPAFGQVGAGIQVPPNSTRYLLAWGVGPHLEYSVSEPSAINIRRWQDGYQVGKTKLTGNDGFRHRYQAPYFVVHRADYHKAMIGRAEELGVNIRSNCTVVGYKFASPADSSTKSDAVSINIVKTSESDVEGQWYSGDLLIAADGVKSLARDTVLQSHGHDPAQYKNIPTSQAAYRATIPLSALQAEPSCKWLLDTPNQNLWIGDNRHAMTYLIGPEGQQVFNLVLSHPEPRPPEDWPLSTSDTVAEMKQHFTGWDENYTILLDILEKSGFKVVKWPITVTPKLPTWTHKSGRMVILGDAAHAMVPYMSQGAAIAVEDGASLAAILSRIEKKVEIEEALSVWETVRKTRGEQMSQASDLNGYIWHLQDSPEQEARDRQMRKEVEGNGIAHGWSPNQWSDPTCQEWTYGYDAEKEVTKAWNRYVWSHCCGA